MIIAFSVVLAIVIAENICIAAYIYFRPDRAILQSSKEKSDFLCAASLKILNRGFGIQGAPPLDGEFDEPEPPGKPDYTDEEIEALGPEEAKAVLEEMEEELSGVNRRQPQGAIERRREMVGKAARLRARLDEGIPPKNLRVSAPGETYVAPPLDSADEAHLESLRQN